MPPTVLAIIDGIDGFHSGSTQANINDIIALSINYKVKPVIYVFGRKKPLDNIIQSIRSRLSTYTNISSPIFITFYPSSFVPVIISLLSPLSFRASSIVWASLSTPFRCFNVDYVYCGSSMAGILGYICLTKSLIKQDKKILLRIHDVFSESLKRTIPNAPIPKMPLYLYEYIKTVMSEHIAAYLMHLFSNSVSICSISVEESRRIRHLFPQAKISVCPYPLPSANISRPLISQKSSKLPIRCGFLAGDSFLNYQSLELIAKAFSDSKLRKNCIHIYGAVSRYCSQLDSSSRILKPHGNIENIEAFYADTTVVVAPILSGSGIKVKIVEALIHGKIILTTPLGIEGIPSELHRSIVIAEPKPEALVEALLFLENNYHYLSSMYFHATELSEEATNYFSFAKVATHFSDILT